MAHWLVTWESAGTHAPPPRGQLIAAVYAARRSAESVAQALEVIYAYECYTPAECLSFTRAKELPYPATFGDINGRQWLGQITCGDNPYLFARLVDNLKPDDNDDLRWNERPRPNLPEL